MTPTNKHIQQSGAFNHIQENSNSDLYATQHKQLPLQTFDSIIPPLHDVSPMISSSAYREQCLDTDQLRPQNIGQIQSKLQCLENEQQIQQRLTFQNNSAEAALQRLGGSASGHKPPYVIAPCPARGMPLDHNYKTAYFTIPDDIKHGDELVCSYFNCQKVGIKFRYCSRCKVPVPKRSFHKIHSHGDETVKNAKRCSSSPDLSYAPSVEISGITTPSATTQTLEKEGSCFVSPLASLRPSTRNKRSCQSKRKSNDITETNHSASKVKRRRQQKIVDFLPEEFLKEEKKKRLWVELLHERPPTSDKKAMSMWLLKVLKVSDPKESTT